MSTYDFDCGCKFEVKNDKIKECDGLPSIYIDYNKDLNYNCQSTWALFASGKTKGVFQLEESLGKVWSKRSQPTSIEDISALVSLIRPGTLGFKLDGKSMTQHYVDRKMGAEEVVYIHPALERILNHTYGVLCYQENSISIAAELAGFDLKQADTLRKCVTDDTMFVSKQRGWITIKELLDTHYNDDFLIMDEHGIQKWKKISKIWSTGKHDVNLVETTFGYSVWATRYHQFLTDSGWKARMRLSNDDYLVAASKIDFDGKDEITRELAIVIAGIITEGYFAITTKNGNRTSAGHFTAFENEMMDIFVDNYKKCFGMTPKFNNGNKVVRFTVDVRNQLHKYMEYGWADTKKIPDVMMRMTKESMRLFLSYMLAAEGGISKRGEFEFSSKSEKMIKQVKYLLLRYGIRSVLHKTYNKKHQEYYYKLSVSDKREQVKLQDELTVLWPSRKKSELKQIIDVKNDDNYTLNLIPPKIVRSLCDQYPGVAAYEGGAVYSRPVSRDKFTRLVNKTDDKKWVNFTNGLQSYTRINNLNKKKRQQVTYDFSMEDSSEPFIIANGLVIHNSIGKKDAKLMSSLRNSFIQGCKTVGLVNEEQANELFDNIEKSNKYSFNKCLSPYDNWVYVLEDCNRKKTRLCNVKIGDWIECPTKDGGTQYCKVKDIHKNGIKTIYRIVFSGIKILENIDPKAPVWARTEEVCYELYSTLDHKVLSKDGNQYSIQQLTELQNLPAIYVNDNLTVKISSIEEHVEEETVDLEIDSDLHCFYANGVAVSNSHGVAYGQISFWTAYAKVHFPLHFCCSYLHYAREKISPQDEVDAIISDSKNLNVDILTPDIRCLFNGDPGDFAISNMKVNFGIRSVKGCGDKNIEKLLAIVKGGEETLNKPISTWSWTELLFLALLNVSKTVVNGLISVGGCSHFGLSRQKMLHEYSVASNINEKELALIGTHLDRLSSLEECLQFLAKSDEVKKVRKDKIISLIKGLNNPPFSLEDTVSWIAEKEKFYLGSPISCIKAETVNAVGNTTCKEYQDGKNLKQMSLVGEIKSTREFTLKAGKQEGLKMCFGTLEDTTGRIDFALSVDKYEELRDIAYKGNLVMVTGKRAKSDNLQVERMVTV